MTEQATVLNPKGSTALVQCIQGAACAGCKGILCKQSDRKFEVLNPQKLPLEEGTKVEIYLAPARALKASFVVLVLPLLFFLAAFGGTALLVPASSEGSRVFVGFIGLVLGFVVVYFSGRRMTDMPEIARVLDSEEGAGCCD